MKKENSSASLFYSYRYFVVKNAQTMLFDNEVSPIDELVKKCEKEKQISIEVEYRKDLFLYIHKYNEQTHLFKFCRDFPIKKYEYDAVKADIIESRESNFPFIYVIIDTQKQMILLENKTAIYSTIDACKNAFTTFVITYIQSLNYSFSMDEIINLSTFWETIENAKKIFELKLNLKSPNLFGSALTTNELLKKLKIDFNNDELDMNLKNSKGNLNITKQTIGDAIDYAGAGGGHWQLSFIRKGQTKKTKMNSKKSIKIIEVTDFEDEIQFEGSHEIIEKIMGLEDIIKEWGGAK